MPIITLTLTTGMLTFFAISALLKVCFVSWMFVQYRRKSRCLADIERMTDLGLATINDRRRAPRYRYKGIL
jgi:hypothetical protein